MTVAERALADQKTAQRQSVIGVIEAENCVKRRLMDADDSVMADRLDEYWAVNVIRVEMGIPEHRIEQWPADSYGVTR